MNLAEHMPWIRMLARRFHRNDREDMVQTGAAKLLEVARHFDPTRGVKIETFARKAVEGAMLDAYGKWKRGRTDRRERKRPPLPQPQDGVQFGDKAPPVLIGRAKRRRVFVACEHCERLYPRRVDALAQRFCSPSCWYAWRKGRICPRCGEAFADKCRTSGLSRRGLCRRCWARRKTA